MYELSEQPAKRQGRGCVARAWSLTWKSAVVVILAFVVLYTLAQWQRPEPLPLTSSDVAAAKAGAETAAYEHLARFTELYVKGKPSLYFRGQVIQVMESGRNYTMRVNVTEDEYGFDDTILLRCRCGVRPLEDDIIEFVATVDGRETYETVTGAAVTLPALTATAFRVE